MANLLPDVAKLLGVKFGERFNVRDTKGDVDFDYDYVLDATGLSYIKDDKNVGDNDILALLLSGRLEVDRGPFKPKNEERYYYPSVSGQCVRNMPWRGETIDYTLRALGMVYRSEEEAAKHFIEDYKKLTGYILVTDKYRR